MIERQKSLEKRVKSLLEWEMKKVDLGVGRRLDSKEKGESGTYRERKKTEKKKIEPLIIKNNISNEYRLFSMVITEKLH